MIRKLFLAFVAVGLIARQLVTAGVIELQIFDDSFMKTFTALAGDLIFIEIH